ncbi:MAG TPA: hypothetical protein VHD88_00100, partial [Pyrinomonadaceae bacterium]|nr:hypothetical protein [Pyrinomonadaceae bacterium]
MVDLPRTRFSSSPLTVIAAALSLGIIASHSPALKFGTAIATISTIGFISTVLSVLLVSKHKLGPAIACVVFAVFCAGFVLSLIDSRPTAPNRIARLYEEGAITAG